MKQSKWNTQRRIKINQIEKDFFLPSFQVFLYDQPGISSTISPSGFWNFSEFVTLGLTRNLQVAVRSAGGVEYQLRNLAKNAPNIAENGIFHTLLEASEHSF